MPSPFPGMDPYLERQRFWLDFHNSLATEIRKELNRTLGPGYAAWSTSQVAYETIELSRVQSMLPDVSVWTSAPTEAAAGTAVVEFAHAPAKSSLAIESPVRLFGVEIRTVDEDHLVTAIDILSRSNKRFSHDDGFEYLRKRRNIIRSDVHLIEIDLLCAGDRPPLEEPVPEAPYYIVLSRSESRPTVDVWPIQLWDPLPTIPVPLCRPDPDVPLDLGAVVNTVYDGGPYSRRVDYRQPPPPPLTDEQAAWVEEHLRPLRT